MPHPYDYAGTDLTLEEIGDRCGLSRERVRQLMPYHAATRSTSRHIRQLIDSELVASAPEPLRHWCRRCGELMVGEGRGTYPNRLDPLPKLCGRCYYQEHSEAKKAANLRCQRTHQRGVIPPDHLRCTGTTLLGDRCRNLAARCPHHRQEEAPS